MALVRQPKTAGLGRFLDKIYS